MTRKISKVKKIADIIGICVASVLIIIAFCGRYFNSGFKHFANFFVGSFGMSFYGFMAGIIVYCSLSLTGRTIRVPKKYVIHFALLFLSVILAVHILTTTYLIKKEIGFSQYIGYMYNYYGDSLGIPTFGGVVFGIIAFALEKAITIYGAMIIVVALMAWTVFVSGEFFYSYFTGKLQLTRENTVVDIEPTQATAEAEPVLDSAELEREHARACLFPGMDGSYEPPYRSFKVSETSSLDDRKTAETPDPIIAAPKRGNEFFNPVYQEPFLSDTSETTEDEFPLNGYRQPVIEEEEKKPETWEVISSPQDSGQEYDGVSVYPAADKEADMPEEDEIPFVPYEEEPEDEEDDLPVDIVDVTSESASDYAEITYPSAEPFEDEVEEPVTEETSVQEVDENEMIAVETEIPVDGGVQKRLEIMTRKELAEKQNSVHQYMKYVAPPFDLLDDVMIVEDLEGEDRKRAADAIVNKLAVFGIKIQLADIIVGPSVTRYMFQVLSQKTRMGAFTQYADDIKACVEAQEDIRIEAPVHGTNMVGIEIANRRKTPVLLRSLLESKEFQQAKGNLVFAIGQEITGKVVVADLSDMPHLLIAGATGSGKSVCLNCLIVSLMYKYGPEYLRFVMIDPKYVELSRYNGIPHMLTSETLTNVQDALGGMDYLIKEMDARYQLFRQNGVGNISEYNSRVNTKLAQKLPYLVFVVDELADLMSISKQAFESKLGRLAQKSRAAGIHIVLATQRPDKNIITGTIKVNLPCRMALKVSSAFDSGTIINMGGAEKLLGKGDMLFRGPGSSDLERVQGAYISNDEIRTLVEFSKASNEIYYDDKISEEIFVSRKTVEEEEPERKSADKETQLDPNCKKALRFWLERNHGKASIASIQRSLGIGFNRAGRIMDTLQKMKYVEELSPSDPSSKPLRVLITSEELDGLFPDMEDLE